MSLMFYPLLESPFLMSVPSRLVTYPIAWSPITETNILAYPSCGFCYTQGKDLYDVQNRGIQVHALTLKLCGGPDPETQVQRKIIFKLISKPDSYALFCLWFFIFKIFFIEYILIILFLLPQLFQIISTSLPTQTHVISPLLSFSHCTSRNKGRLSGQLFIQS